MSDLAAMAVSAVVGLAFAFALTIATVRGRDVAAARAEGARRERARALRELRDLAATKPRLETSSVYHRGLREGTANGLEAARTIVSGGTAAAARENLRRQRA